MSVQFVYGMAFCFWVFSSPGCRVHACHIGCIVVATKTVRSACLYGFVSVVAFGVLFVLASVVMLSLAILDRILCGLHFWGILLVIISVQAVLIQLGQGVPNQIGAGGS